MDWTQLRWALVVVAGLALPASAQGIQNKVAPAPTPTGLPPDGTAVAAPNPTPVRPGLFGWRIRQAQRKRHLQETFVGYPEEFNERQLGQSLYSLGRTEAANGAAARLILNHYDFVGDTAELNYRGQDKLTAIAAQLPHTFAPVIVERTPWAPKVAEKRRQAIVGKLAHSDFPVPAERILIGQPIARGLTGAEAIIVDGTRLTSFANGGTNVAGTGFSGGGGSGGVMSGSITR